MTQATIHLIAGIQGVKKAGVSHRGTLDLQKVLKVAGGHSCTD